MLTSPALGAGLVVGRLRQGPLPGLQVGWQITRAPVRYVASSGREMEGCAMDEVEGPQEWHISMGYTLDWLQARFERGEHSDTWTGLSTLDWLLGEPHAGLAMEVQCESAMMRTAFLLGVALEAARNGKRTLFVSGALSETETGLRVLSMLSGVDLGRMRWGRLLEGHWRLMGDALANDLPMHTWSLRLHAVEQLQRANGETGLAERHRGLAQQRLQVQAAGAEVRRFVDDQLRGVRVERLHLVERCEEGGFLITDEF